MDEEERYEGFLGGTWAPDAVGSYTNADVEDPATGATYEFLPLYAPTRDDLKRVQQWYTPEATTSVCDKMLPGFAEKMRSVSLNYVPTAILSRQVAGIRGESLIINLPGSPKSIREI